MDLWIKQSRYGMGTGFVIGPYLEGKLSDFSIHVIFNLTILFWTAFFLCLLKYCPFDVENARKPASYSIYKISLVTGIQ